ncbi:MAG: butanol dehydrogenase [Haloplasmataceae bacterium]|jgi:alcohol dehydrogenase YqhD (iron-dependent ADH family)|nr:butanol dehydrogenase [Haloplasmataceae bacterium]
MENFILYNPTKLYFGKNQIQKLKEELKGYNHILLVYGGGSIKKTGLYDQVTDILKEAKVLAYELSGVEPNPKITLVRKGIDLVKKNKVDLILAVGGGSTIDCAKAISIGSVSDYDIMEIFKYNKPAKKVIKLGVILTLSATGSEMNPRIVISDNSENLKLGIGNFDLNVTYPDFSICDPTFTLTVPLNQTINGVIDIISHVLEQYFNQNKNSILGDEIAESILRTMFDLGPKIIKDLENYELRETMMICGTLAWNGLLRGLTNNGDWSCHGMEHALSAVYDIPHAEGLAIITPIWMDFVSKIDSSKFVSLAKNVFKINTENKTDDEIAIKAIEYYRNFLSNLHAPTSMKYYNITEFDLDALVEKTLLGKKTLGHYVVLSEEEVKDLLNKCFIGE